MLANVWNSLPFGTCPQAEWDQLETDAIAADFPDATLVHLNGPRFFLMHKIFQHDPPVEPTIHDFRQIRMALATVAIDPLQAGDVYQEIVVKRATTFSWRAGERVFELTHADKTYVM